jgi:flagellar basal body rod protein FlgB
VLNAATGQIEAVDLEAEMVALADEQLRFEAAVKLLEQVYAQVRSSVRER